MEAYRSKFGRRYDRKFKENAVALVQSGRTISEVARDLGVSQWSLNRNGFNVSFPRADNPGYNQSRSKASALAGKNISTVPRPSIRLSAMILEYVLQAEEWPEPDARRVP